MCAGAYDTSFIDQNLDTLVAWSAGVEPEEAEAAAGSTAEPAEKAAVADEAPAAAGDGTAAEPAAPATPRGGRKRRRKWPEFWLSAGERLLALKKLRGGAATESRRTAATNVAPRAGRDLPEEELAANQRVCPYCGHHFPLPARERPAHHPRRGLL